MHSIKPAKRGGGVRRDAQAANAEIAADSIDDEDGPAEVDDEREDEVHAEVVQLYGGGDSGAACIG